MSSKEWTSFKIEDLGRVVTGKTPPTQNSDNFGNKYPFITPRDMSGQKRIIKTERYLSEEGKKTVKNCLLPKDAICVSCIGSDMGKVVLTTQDSVTNQQLNSIICKQEFNPDFVYYSIINISDTLRNVAHHSTAVPILNKSDFSNFEILSPAISTQNKIASILSALDDKLELNRQTNATLEAIAQTIFKEWFVDFKFPGATGEMQESELGMIPKGWTALPIYETAEFINGAAYKETDFTPDNSGLPVIKIAELKYGITSQTRFSKTIKNENSRIDNGDILFSWSGSPDTSIDVFVWAGDAGILNQHIFRVVNGDTDKKYYECYLLKYLKPIFIEIARDKQTTGLGHVTAQDMRRIKIAYPDKKSIGMFAEKIGPIFEKSLNNSLQTATLVRLRDSLLPKLMNGEIEA